MGAPAGNARASRALLIGNATLTLLWRLGAAYLALMVIARLLPLGARTTRDLEAAFLLPPIALAVAATVWASSRASGREKRLWRYWSVTTAAFLAGMSYRLFSVVNVGHYPAAGSFEDLAFIVAFLAQIPAMMIFAEMTTMTRSRRARSHLDFLAILAMTLGLTHLALLAPLDAGGERVSLLQNVVFSLYPVLSIAFVAYVGVFKRRGWWAWERYVFASIVLSAAGTFVTAVGMPLSIYAAGKTSAAFTDVAWAAAFLCIAFAPLKRHSASAPARGVTPIAQYSERPGLAVSLLALAVLPWLIVGGRGVADTFYGGVIAWSAALLAIVIVARSMVYSHEVVTLRATATVDALTGLGNRSAFHDRLAAAMRQREADGRPLALCVFDIASFEALNLRRGFRAGDDLLRRLASSTATIMGDVGGGGVYRVGGDDFAVILPGLDADAAAGRCVDLVALAAGLVPGELVELVCGIAACPLHADNADDLLRLAEGAMYWAKSAGGEQIVVYDPDKVVALDAREHVALVSADTQTRMVEALAAAVDARDSYTEEHSRRVAHHAAGLAARIRLPQEQIEHLHTAALLHDIGKVGVPDAILLKPAPLTSDERRIVERHPEIGERILGRGAHAEILGWVRWHHERWDGRGYPDGLRREQIPVEARILCLCDAYDAMRTTRPYRAAMSHADACAELRRASGTQFDPDLVAHFSVVLEEADAG